MRIFNIKIISSITLSAYASLCCANDIASVVAASLTTQVVSTGTAVYMKNNGMNPQLVSTPYGTYVVPANTANTNTPAASNATPAPSAYEIQNQQQNKIQFLNGNVVQAFPDVSPADTAGN